MNAALELIDTLDEIGALTFPWAAPFKVYANALRRNSKPDQLKSREVVLHRLEGAEDMACMASLLNDELLARLGEQLIEAWEIHSRGEWPQEAEPCLQS